MGTEVITKMECHTTKEFWGGNERGVCMQVTASAPLRIRETTSEQLQEERFIQLTMEEAAALCNTLGAFVKREATRRQALLREEIKQAKIAEKTVFQEVAELPTDLMAGPELAVLMVSKLCPRVGSVSRNPDGKPTEHQGGGCG